MIDGNLEIWEGLFQNNEWGKYPALGVVKFIARNFYKASDRKAIKVLEIGAGTGANLWYVAREGFSVYAIEGSKTAIDNCEKRLREEGLSEQIKDFYAGDYLYELDNFEDGFFDAVIDVESLCCNVFDKSKKIIDLVYKKLKPGGVFYSQTFNEGTWGLEVGEEVDYHAMITINRANVRYGTNTIHDKKGY
ncbi:MAG: class I SAM-dependent methyltransferase [Flavobacteriales bacterium]|nr:class I SAM-dependent methyltransferase [Flavobacteriales bacterium]